MSAGHSVQDVLRNTDWRGITASGSHPVLHQLVQCRTAAMGWHLHRCNNSTCTGHQQMQYHSCRNRHCPNCGWSRQEEWTEARMRELVPASYFHVVFTLPAALHGIAMGNRKAIFTLLFEAAAHTLMKFAHNTKNLNANPGIVAVLHTWGQQLSFHPHVHCVVTGGGINAHGRWQSVTKYRRHILFPVKAMQAVYRGYFMEMLKKGIAKNKIKLNAEQRHELPQLIDSLYKKDWIVYAKKPFGGPQQVIQYLSRYTHKTAISNHRIQEVTHTHVRFKYRDYTDQNRVKEMTLTLEEFVRRFEQHILPQRFVRIRSYGMYANRMRHQRLAALRKAENWQSPGKPLKLDARMRILIRFGKDIHQCPVCKTGRLVLVETVRRQIALPQKIPETAKAKW